MHPLIIALCLVTITIGVMYLLYHAKKTNDVQIQTSEAALEEVSQIAVATKDIVKKLSEFPEYMGYDRIVEFLAKHCGNKFYNTATFTKATVVAEAFLSQLLAAGWIIRKEWKVVEQFEPTKVFFVLSYKEENFVQEPTNEQLEHLVVLQANELTVLIENVDAENVEQWKDEENRIKLLSEFVAYVPSHCEEYCQSDALRDSAAAAKLTTAKIKMAKRAPLKESAPTYIYDKDAPTKFVLDTVRLTPVRPSFAISYPQITAEEGKKMVNLDKFLDLAVARMGKMKTNFSVFGPPNAGKSSILRELIFRAYTAGLTVVKATGAQFGAMMNDATAKIKLASLGERVLVVIDEAAGFTDDLAQVLLSATEGLNDDAKVSIVLCTNTEEAMGGTYHEALLRSGRMAALLNVNALKPEQWKPLVTELQKLHEDQTWVLPTDITKDYLLGEVYSWAKDPLLGDEWLKDAVK